MANQKNQVIPIPLNGELNFSKNKTKVSQFSGFNDLNSPIYGGMISPFYMKIRNRDSAGNDRPYLDDKKVLRDKNGQEILDISSYKGLKRSELKNVPEDALAVYDENTYIDIVRNGESYYTALHYGDFEKGENKTKTLSYKANAAAYTENGQIIINEQNTVHIYDAETLNELASGPSISTETAELITFYDPLAEWQLISIYQPFGDWEYRKVSSYFELSEVWRSWDEELKDKEREIKRLTEESEASKAAYNKLKEQQDQIQADIDDSKKLAESYLASGRYWRDKVSKYWWRIFKLKEFIDNQDYYYGLYRSQNEKTYELTQKLDAWNKENGDELQKAWEGYDQKVQPINLAKSEKTNIEKREPQKYLDPEGTSAANPNIYTGKTGEAYCYIFNPADNSLTRKLINIPWDELGEGSQGPTSESYIITGIYDSYFDKDASGKWNYNTGVDYVRYRLGVIPHNIDLGLNAKEPKKYFFSLNYTPKIYFRQDSPSKEWKISANIPNETKTYICNTKDKEMAQDSDVYFSGSGAGNRAIIWGKVNFVPKESEDLIAAKEVLRAAKEESARTFTEKNVALEEYKQAQKEYDDLPKPTPEDEKKLEDAKNKATKADDAYTAASKHEQEAQQVVDDIVKTLPDFNKLNLFHDLGYAKYTMYSPWSAGPNRGNATTNEVSGARDIARVNFNYEVSGDGLLWKKPTVGGEYIQKNTENTVFREIINNGVISNVSIAESIKHIGTFIETPNSIDPKVNVFYKNGKNGNEIIYKTTQGKWISTKVIDNVEDIKIINNEYVVIYTTKVSNCIRLKDNEIVHFAPDWNNRFSLVGSPYEEDITPIAFPAINNVESGVDASDIFFSSGINVNYEVTQNPIVGYTSAVMHIFSNENNITPVGFVSDFDNIDFYYTDILKDKTKVVPVYYISSHASSVAYGLFNNIDLSGLLYPISIINNVGLFCKIRPSNFGRFYLDDGTSFYSLAMYNGQLFFAYETSSLLDDIKDLFMVQGQTFAITKSNYLYSVFIDQRGRSSLGDAIANVKGLQFCGAIPEMAIFYSPVDRTLKSFTADHMIRNMEEANLIDNVYYTTYSPQTSSVYICTNNGVYIYSSTNKYRLPVYAVEEIYFGGDNDKHIYILNDDIEEDDITKTIHLVNDYIFDRGFSATQLYAKDETNEYKIQPVFLETKYYGQGNNLESITDCIYFRLYSDEAPFTTDLKIKEFSLTDTSYKTLEKAIKINKSDWDERTKTCYIRYQPKNQRNVGLSIQVISECAISEVNFSNSLPETVAISKPRMNG